MWSRGVIAAVLGASLLSVSLAMPEPAAACVLAPFADAEERLARQIEVADAIVVGSVALETAIGEGATMPGGSGYTSIVRVDATLKGDTNDAIVIPNLGSAGGMCSDVPRMMVGERVLLFLVAERRPPEASQHVTPIWHVALLGQGKYRLTDGKVFYQFPTDQGRPPESVDNADALIQNVAQRVGSSEQELGRALASHTSDRGSLPVAVGVTALTVVLVAGGLARSRVRRRFSGTR